MTTEAEWAERYRKGEIALEYVLKVAERAAVVGVLVGAAWARGGGFLKLTVACLWAVLLVWTGLEILIALRPLGKRIDSVKPRSGLQIVVGFASLVVLFLFVSGVERITNELILAVAQVGGKHP